MDATSSNDEEVPPGLARQVRAALADLLTGTTPVPPGLEGLPVELWLERIIPVAIAAELLSVTPETVLKKYRANLIPLDGRRFGMRLRDALKLKKGGHQRKK
jgi:hypothetical protein